MGELHGEMQASGGNSGKSPSVVADKALTWGRHGARPAQRGILGGRREDEAIETLVVRGGDRGREASGVAHKSPGVGDEEGGCKASRVAENPQGSHQEVSGGVELPQ